MKYYFIAGERSGDLHCANLYKAIKELDVQAEAKGIGGGFMHDAGISLVKNYEDLALIGFWEILEKLGSIRSALKEVKRELSSNPPDVLILVDYAGFNLRVARFAKELGIKVYYYISPKIWAWNESRVKTIKAFVDKMFVILPFEKEFYQKHDYQVDYIGNPILDSISQFVPNPNFRKENSLEDKPIIAILPGSRSKEIESTLFRMLSILPAFPDHQFVVAGVDNFPSSYYENFRRNGLVHIVYEQTYDLLKNAEMAIVTSGTATLETALFRVPQVVVYRVNILSYWIAKMLVKIKFISLVNLIAGKQVVTELIQDEFNPANIRNEMEKLKMGEASRLEILKGYEEIADKIGKPGASKRAAALIFSYLKEAI